MTNLPQTIKTGVSAGREWSITKFENGARTRGYDPIGRLLAVFDVLDDITNRADREARAFVASLSGTAMVLDLTRAITRLAAESPVRDVENLVLSLRLLVTGAAASAVAGDLDSARRARGMARTLVDRHRSAGSAQEPVAEAQPMIDNDHELDRYLDWEL